MKIKNGVVMAGLQMPIRKVLKTANIIWSKHGQELVITSALDGEHSSGSLHYYGYAVDLRSRYFPDLTSKEVTINLQTELGSDYTVIFEGNHIHVHYNAHKLLAIV